jgi:hypothetical protein
MGPGAGGQLSTTSLWIIVDKVDKTKIECMICAICLVYNKNLFYVTRKHDSTGAVWGSGSEIMTKLLKK